MIRYSGYFRNALQTRLAYRANVWLHVAAACLGSLIQLYLWRAVYRAGPSHIGGYSLGETLTYTVISSSLGAFLFLEMRLDSKVRDGSIALSLAKPADWHLMVASESLGSNIFTLFAVCLPSYLVFLSGGVILPPASSMHAAGFVLAIGLGWAILFSFCYVTGLASFFTKAGWGFVEIQATIVLFFAGALVPLAMYPVWLQQVAAWLPFQGIYNLPLSIYLGKVSLEALPKALLGQATWVLVLALLGRLLWHKAITHLTVQGG